LVAALTTGSDSTHGGRTGGSESSHRGRGAHGRGGAQLVTADRYFGGDWRGQARGEVTGGGGERTSGEQRPVATPGR
jgi:hypothetical protein